RRRGGVQRPRARAPGGDRSGGERLDEGRDVKIAVADYGAGNLRSVCAGFERAGAEPVVTTELRDAPVAVIAGVGNAASAAVELERRGLAAQLRERVAAGRPVFGICLGMQLLFGESEEGGCGL